jgi:hypothetical protein
MANSSSWNPNRPSKWQINLDGLANSLANLRDLKQKLKVHTAHKLTTSAEIFYKIYGIITEHPELESQLVKKLEARGFQELQFSGGRRYIVRASNSATRGISQHRTQFGWMKPGNITTKMFGHHLRFTQMASANPQAFLLSNAGELALNCA